MTERIIFNLTLETSPPLPGGKTYAGGSAKDIAELLQVLPGAVDGMQVVIRHHCGIEEPSNL